MSLEVKSGGHSGEGPKKYIGMTPVKVIAINPTREELETIYGKALEKEPQYVFDKDGKRSVLINIWLKSTNEVNGMPIIFNQLKIWISDNIVLFKTKDGVEKCRIIDDYGECATVTSAEFQAGLPPKNSRIVGTFRPAKRGEETLVSFIKAWIDVQNSTKWDSSTKSWVPVEQEKLQNASIKYDWQQWLEGDVSDLKNCVTAFKDKLFQVAVGLEKGFDNVWYQTIFSDYFMRGWETSYGYMQKQIDRFMEGETSVLVNKDTREYNRVPRKEVYQFNADWIKVWEQPVATFNQGGEGMPSIQEAVKKEESEWDKFLKTETAGNVKDLPPMNEDIPDPGFVTDLPF